MNEGREGQVGKLRWVRNDLREGGEGEEGREWEVRG